MEEIKNMIGDLAPLTEKEAKRQESNREIVKIISELVEKHPHQRFWQLLYNMRIINHKTEHYMNIKEEYNKESMDILNDLKEF